MSTFEQLRASSPASLDGCQRCGGETAGVLRVVLAEKAKPSAGGTAGATVASKSIKLCEACGVAAFGDACRVAQTPPQAPSREVAR